MSGGEEGIEVRGEGGGELGKGCLRAATRMRQRLPASWIGPPGRQVGVRRHCCCVFLCVRTSVFSVRPASRYRRAGLTIRARRRPAPHFRSGPVGCRCPLTSYRRAPCSFALISRHVFLSRTGPEPGDNGCDPRKPVERERRRIAVQVIQSEHRFLPGHIVAAQLCDVQIAAVLRYAGVRLRL